MSHQHTTPEEKVLVLAALSTSRSRQYQVLELHLRGLPQKAIAAALGLGQPEVSRLLKRALKNARALKDKALARR